jgi:hypothetical protein
VALRNYEVGRGFNAAKYTLSLIYLAVAGKSLVRAATPGPLLLEESYL